MGGETATEAYSPSGAEKPKQSGTGPPGSHPAVEMTSISKHFGTVTALDDVDLTLDAGAIHALLGENGAGKSTLMHILAGEIQPASGSISVSNVPVTA